MTATTMPKKEEEQPSPSPPGSTTCVEMAIEGLAPARALPPGVYFSPTKTESVLNYLNRWIAGDAMRDADGFVIEHDVYAEHPGVLAGKYRPASTRDAEPSWWFLCLCKLQHTRRRSATPRCERGVATGGYWKLEQKTEKVECAVTRQILGFRRSFGFYLKKHKEDENPAKTWWLMEEYTSGGFPQDGFVLADGKRALPALYRIYVTPRDHDEKDKTKNNTKKKRGRDDDDAEDDHHNGAPMTADRVLVPADYFDAIKALLPQSSVPVVGQEQTQDTQEAPPLPLPGVLNMYQAYDASPGDDDHTMNVQEMHATPEERQGNTHDDGESPQQRDLLLVDKGITTWEMGRDDALADSSWIDQHY